MGGFGGGMGGIVLSEELAPLHRGGDFKELGLGG